MRVLVGYASKRGATAEIAEVIAERLRKAGLEVEVLPAQDISTVDGFDAVVLGSAVYAGSWRKEAVELAERHGGQLARVPVWLFSSGPLGEDVDDNEEQPKQLRSLRDSLAPRDHRVFFGALDPSKLGFGERMVVKAVKAPEGDFRDWDEIHGWADTIAEELGS
jgi:menaquinone-dependent protoporphyrinogen oxidase